MQKIIEQDYLWSYLAAAYKVPMLSREREVELAVRMKAGGRAGERARDELVAAHLKLVASMARKLLPGGSRASLEDVIQEGNIGLLKAVDRFDVERGFRLATYAWHWIRQEIQLFLTTNGGAGVIRLPITQIRKIQDLKRAIAKLKLSGVAPTDTAIAKELGESVDYVRQLMESLLSECSLNVPVGSREGGKETELGDLIEDQTAENAESLMISAEDRQRVHEAISTLGEREQAIITMRFGLDGGEEQTLEEIATRFSVTRERIRQIEAKVKTKLGKRLRRA